MPLPRIEQALLLLPCVTLLLGTAHAQPASVEEPPPQFRPTDLPLDQVGYAGVTGSADQSVVSAAHRTLPIPSFVEVTSLATGRTILVQIDRRGPEAGDRLIDLSCGAARQLGLSAIPAAVRVRRVSPPEQERGALAAGRTAAARLDAPAGLLSALRRKLPAAPPLVGSEGCPLSSATAPLGQSTNIPQSTVASSKGLPNSSETQAVSVSAPIKPAPVTAGPRPPVDKRRPSVSVSSPKPAAIAAGAPHVVEKPRPPVSASQLAKGGYAIQIVALSNKARADSVARSIGGYVETSGSVFRVRKGPYPSDTAARAALSQIRAKGFADARVVTNEGR
ncbi:MAG TPA: SPOR domain-containing protein [Sphingobium sp.]|uniref:SPOR domain-containing protein n=1 Tax=Sphingobium sp. TaxID=1912891 RepID=UPI002ED3A2FF